MMRVAFPDFLSRLSLLLLVAGLVLFLDGSGVAARKRGPLETQPWIARIGAFKNGSAHTALNLTGETANFEWLCAGALISDRVVITAAHCLIWTRENMRVRLGENDTTRTKGNEVDRRVVKGIAYPDSSERAHDVSLLLLDKPVPLQGAISTIHLPEKGQMLKTGDTVLLGGWGQTEYKKPDSIATLVKHAVREMVDIERCRAYVSEELLRKLNGLQPRDYLCVSATLDQAICNGDSGGPVAFPEGCIDPKFKTEVNHCSRYVLMGIINFGAGCGSEIAPSINLAIEPHLDWIAETMEKFKKIS